MPSSSGWFVRGGNYSDGVYTGILYFTGNVPYSISGAASANVGARAVLLLSDYNIVPMVTLAYISLRTYIISDNVEVFILALWLKI